MEPTVHPMKPIAWPNWDAHLGTAPGIIHGVQPGESQPSYDERLTQILSNISEAARKPQAIALREQLKELSGMQIDIRPGDENETMASKWIHIRGQAQMIVNPNIRFNPDLWQRYATEGAVMLSEPHFEKRSLTDKNGALQVPVTYAPATFDRYGIASPEQLLLHELASYAYYEKAYRQEIAARTPGMDSQMTSELLDEARVLKQMGNDMHLIVDGIENPSMASVIPGYTPRSAKYLEHSINLKPGPEGIPEVHPEEAEALKKARVLHSPETLIPMKDQHHHPLRTALDGLDASQQSSVMARIIQNATNQEYRVSDQGNEKSY